MDQKAVIFEPSSKIGFDCKLEKCAPRNQIYHIEEIEVYVNLFFLMIYISSAYTFDRTIKTI